MTREKSKELLPIIQAFAEGKTIEFLRKSLTGATWTELDDPDFTWNANNYRIKPESKYRPFKSKEECWNEMLKHQPFGWLKSIHAYYSVSSVGDAHIWMDDKDYFTFEEAVKGFNFADGTPFGINEE